MGTTRPVWGERKLLVPVVRMSGTKGAAPEE